MICQRQDAPKGPRCWAALQLRVAANEGRCPLSVLTLDQIWGPSWQQPSVGDCEYADTAGEYVCLQMLRAWAEDVACSFNSPFKYSSRIPTRVTYTFCHSL